MTNPFLGSVSLEAYLDSVTLDSCLEFFIFLSLGSKKKKQKQMLIKLCEFVG